MLARSNRLEVRNPALTDPEIVEIARELTPEGRLALRKFLLRLRRIGAVRFQASLASHKLPQALYWKVFGVWAYHLARVLK